MLKRVQQLNMGITSKVVISMFIVILTIMLLVASYSFTKSKKLMVFQLEREFSSEISIVEKEVFSFFEQKGEIVKQLSIIPVIKSILIDEDKESVQTNPDYVVLQEILAEAVENNEDVELLWLANVKHRNSIANNGYLSNSLLDIENRPWFKESKSKDGLFYSDPYLDFATDQLTMSVINPIQIEGERLAYLGVDVHIDSLPAMLKQFETDGRHLILVAGDNHVLYDEQNMWDVFENQKFSNSNVLNLELDGEKYYSEISIVEGMGWKIILYVPEKIVLQPFAEYQKTLLTFWIIALTLLLTMLSIVLRFLLKDISRITYGIDKMKNGDYGARVGIVRQDEIGIIARAFDQMANKIQIQMKEMTHQAHHDSLTKQPNRNSIEEKLDELIVEANKNGQIITVVFMDLDNFKEVNDTYGHAYGDELLIKVGNRIRDLLPKDSFFGRLGGDEFVLLIPGDIEDLSSVRGIIKRVHKSFADVFKIFDTALYITSSMGVSIFPEDSTTKEGLFTNSDTALYKSKEAGRNKVFFFDPNMKLAFETEIKLNRGLRTAVKNNEFFLVYQPQLDIKSGKMTSMEALIRWNHPEWGLVSPDEFIPLAEKSGQICPIGDWVIDTSLQMIKGIVLEFPYIERVCVNVSAIQLREKDFVQKLINALDKHTVPPKLLEIELTESVIINNDEGIIEKLAELKALGIQIALDDFGTGYSSLNYLRLMPIDRIKVDKSFVDHLDDDPIVMAILRTIIELGHGLNFEIVAEGVVDISQYHLLEKMQVDLIQGFYFARAMDEESLYLFLRQKESEMAINHQ
ncbi:EAL domain-containing protein [Sporosarcina siberiensis]|uniref:EAL domain-containing protein n=1 Tax=Sporosarcina siberiensis TaxID=1365606 RepID=A0ABW4SD97_9BACL